MCRPGCCGDVQAFVQAAAHLEAELVPLLGLCAPGAPQVVAGSLNTPCSVAVLMCVGSLLGMREFMQAHQPLPSLPNISPFQPFPTPLEHLKLTYAHCRPMLQRILECINGGLWVAGGRAVLAMKVTK